MPDLNHLPPIISGYRLLSDEEMDTYTVNVGDFYLNSFNKRWCKVLNWAGRKAKECNTYNLKHFGILVPLFPPVPEGYNLISDENYKFEENDLFYTSWEAEHNDKEWVPVKQYLADFLNKTIEKKSRNYDFLVVITPINKAPKIPHTHEPIEDLDYKLKAEDLYRISHSSWVRVSSGGITNFTIKSVRDIHGSDFKFAKLKEIKPRFPCERPFPFGY
jgi:hypothetical protein